MSEVLENIEKWKLKLLDLGKRNRLINFKETKRSNISIVKPSFEEIFDTLVTRGQFLEFTTRDPRVNVSNYDRFKVEETIRFAKVDINKIVLKKGQVLSNKTDSEMFKTLAQLRSKAKTALEEQGVNILYVAFGFLEWRESEFSNTFIKSPILLVPVQLTLESVVDPYRLFLTDDDTVINPTLLYKLQRDFNLSLPEWAEEEEEDISKYLSRIQSIVKPNGWKVSLEVQLSLFSFLKLNMYQDLEKYQDIAAKHFMIRALSGDASGLSPTPEELVNGYDHDNKLRPIDTFQVVDADSSQQDAIIYAKKGVSFILQGPPGTGKSQTITNIIAECLADGKKVLFVSEKVAALEVVYKRLKESGLTDFCLQLHSHKTNKKLVLDELGRTLHLPKSQTRDEAIADLEQLSESRKKLNEYARSLHTVCEPLGKSVYEIHGRIAKYRNAPDVEFSFSGVGDATQGDINRYERLLRQFSLTASKLGSDYKSSPWYGCTANAFTLELQHDVMTHFPRLSTLLEEARSLSQSLTSQLLLEPHTTVHQLESLRRVLEVASRSTMPPKFWITTQEIRNLTEKAEKLLVTSNSHAQKKKDLLSRYKASILEVDAENVAESFTYELELARAGLNETVYGSPEKIEKHQIWLSESLENIISVFTDLEKGANELCNLLGLNVAQTVDELNSATHAARTLLTDPRPTSSWFDSNKFTVIKDLSLKAREYFQQIARNETELSEGFNREFLDLDPGPLLARFNTEYNSVLKYFKSAYRKDRKMLLSFKKDPAKKMKDPELIRALQRVKEINEAKGWVSAHEDDLKIHLGTWYNSRYSDWDSLFSAFESFSRIQECFPSNLVPDKVRSLLLQSGSAIENLRSIIDKVSFALNQTDLIERASRVLRLSSSPIFREVLATGGSVSVSLRKLSAIYDSVCTHLEGSNVLAFSEMLHDLEQIAFLHETENQIRQQSIELRELYGHYFDGLDTDWELVLGSLAWASEFQQAVSDFALPEAFVELICTSRDAIELSKDGVKKLSILQETRKELVYVQGLFANRTDLPHLSLAEFKTWLEACLNNFGALEEWLDFRRSREQCIAAGLGNFVEAVIAENLPSQKIVGAFFKRFYRLWLDAMYQRIPALADFRRRSHEGILEEFKALDKKQLAIAQARLKAYLSSKLPSSNFMSSASGEIGILRHELNKRKRIKPLRKLFKTIPNLLLTLKPCLMMSPLSVSLFLDPEEYKFDVVIFDEASQIFPEDAIGAIFRANQAIIAGDSEQLPPTNFFNASTGDSEYEDDEDDNDSNIEAYESILDHARSILPEITLRWHYRSKHEHLIAFSNTKIYAKKHESLITFPACIDRIKDNGVEYIYTPEGVYERGGSKSNKVEAEKIASLVFEHFRKYPNRSLGVVTFSEAQKNQVEASIRHLRAQSPQFESFFDESREESFFIKNLESVQGDERDTIIFSIGYAKDSNGVMHMNFGPLSKAGGYRRLNVAITRAKYNVKLIGSILPTDIDLDKTSSDGVKMLRSYIEFAMHGPDALLNELVVPEVVYTESPFEEEVYSFLSENGYKIDTQVGCSGYRIDMAIRHPTLSGRYVLGVECDGATYHSARTARERDRLREDVLRERGWTLYRIWSTDWIKDPVSEGQRLLYAIEKAIENYSEEVNGVIGLIDEQFTPSLDITVEDLSEEILGNSVGDALADSYGFAIYEMADIFQVPRNQRESDKIYLSRLIQYVTEVEGPIHVEHLCKRLAPIFGRERVTSLVRKTVHTILRTHLNNVITVSDNFCKLKQRRDIIVRIPSSPETVRKIEYICKEEVAEAMYSIVKNKFGLTYEELFQETSRIFGFNRTGEKIKTALFDALVFLIDNQRVDEKNGKVSLRA